ncbi:hypothetical protein ACFUCV_06680 [Specibacter sp. NPDC057265]|uniref:hypothetical protein n=1 Tax=Specibacter sp. NPDC057265 TaxID=3346075 RepID=UPI00363F0BEF
MAPAPVPVEVFLHSGPAQWWQVASAWTPLFVLFGAVLAAVIAWRTLKQQTRADALALEQKQLADGRTQWALDHALDKDPSSRALGLVALGTLAGSELAPVEELEMLESMSKIVAQGIPGLDPEKNP